MRLKSGQAGELAAEQWFRVNEWHMVRTQPETTILGMVTPAMVGSLKRFIPCLSAFGHMVICRMGKGGISDYTGFEGNLQIPAYRAVEVKEATGDTMPCSRLDKDQRAFLSSLPTNCAWVGILWVETGKFTMHRYQERGSYKRT